MLSDDFEKLFLHERDCDVSIKVKDKIFKAHKLIVKARSETIASMLPDDTAEKNFDVIKIDCEPEAFEIVLLYLYSGKTEKLSDTNMLDVYYVAESYDITDLKSECVSYVKRSMTVKNISSIIQFAKKHAVDELLSCATDFFTENAQEIILTQEWKMFIKNEPTYGHELYEEVIKSLTAATKNYY